MTKNYLVTGANGHLGQHVVQSLLEQGLKVKAGVRQPGLYTSDNPNLTYCRTDMLDESSMNEALKEVDVLIHCAAVFKHWAKNPEQEIVQANIEGTRITLEAAARNKVKKVIYVSSVAAVGHKNGSYLNEVQWNTSPHNPCYHSKILSEQLAWKLAKNLELDLVSILPSAMIGPISGRMTDTMNFIQMIYQQTLPFNPNFHFHFNFVDVRDVANTIVEAIDSGRNGERYILSNSESSSLEIIMKAATGIGLELKRPIKLPKPFMWFIATAAELLATLTGKPAELTRSQIKLFHGIRQNYDHSKARKELNFQPRTPEEAIVSTLEFFKSGNLTS